MGIRGLLCGAHSLIITVKKRVNLGLNIAAIFTAFVIFAELLCDFARRKGDAMVSVKVASVAGAVALLATVANAAYMPSMPLVYMPPVEEFSVSGWYLRGDIGMTNQRFKGLHQRQYHLPSTSLVTPVGMGCDSTTLFGLGVGYKFNDWFRTDFTANIAARRTSTAWITSSRPSGQV